MSQTHQSATDTSRRLTGEELDGIAGGVTNDQFVVQINGHSQLLAEKHVETPTNPFNLAGEQPALKIASSTISVENTTPDKNPNGVFLETPLMAKINSLSPEKKAAYDEYQKIDKSPAAVISADLVTGKNRYATPEEQKRMDRIEELKNIIDDKELTPPFSFKGKTGNFSKINIKNTVETNPSFAGNAAGMSSISNTKTKATY